MADDEGAVVSEAPLKRRLEELFDATGSKRLRPEQKTDKAVTADHPDEGLQAVAEAAAGGLVAAAEPSGTGKGLVEDDDNGRAEVEGEICDGLKVEGRQALKIEAAELISPKAGRAEEMEGEGEGEGEVVEEERRLEAEGNAGGDEEDDEAASELDAEEEDGDDADSESDEDDEDEEDEEEEEDSDADLDAADESRAQEGSSAKGKAKVDIKGKGIVKDTGKGKAKLEDEEVIDEEEVGYLSEDALEEVDLNNILSSRTRGRNVSQPTYVDTVDLGDDEDDDDYHGE